MAQLVHLMKVEFARARRYRLPLTFLVLSIDRLNDLSRNFGYKARDLVIERFRAILRRDTRNCDFIGRMREDRILLVLPHTDVKGAKVLAERIRRTMAAQEFHFEAKAFRVTLSAGICPFGNRDTTLFFDAMRDAADEAANRASASGDAVVVVEARDDTAGAAKPETARRE